jgi:hypothetical protein
MIRYEFPQHWIRYDALAITNELTAAKAAVLSLAATPFQRSWADELQVIQLKLEVAGTSRIEGAEFTEKELDAAMKETPEQLHTRSQRQAAAAVATYRWIAKLPNDLPINADLVCETHRRIVAGADDDHCTPGKLRARDENVNFGVPRHCGCEGGDECSKAFGEFCRAMQQEFTEHDPLIQALALHYQMVLEELSKKTEPEYRKLNSPDKALIRDFNYLFKLGAIGYKKLEDNRYRIFAKLEWPTQITETEFFARVKQMPKAKSHSFLD